MKITTVWDLAYLAAIAAGLLAALPDYWTLPILGLAALLAGFLLASTYWWGWLIVFAGGALAVAGLRNYLHTRRLANDEAEKASNEVRRRAQHSGKIPRH